jgi:hypothetical protein
MTAGRRLIRLNRLSRLLVLAIGLCLTRVPVLQAAESPAVAVGVSGGKVFLGQVDSRTDANRLWLRIERPGIVLRRPIDWESILLVRQGDHEFSSHEFRTQALATKSTATSLAENDADELPAPAVAPAPNDAGSNRSQPTEKVAGRPKEWIPDHRLANFIEASRANNTQVCSLSIDAHVANFNRTVEADGLILHIYPLDGAGNMVAVDGTLDVELIASVPPGWPRGEPLPNIGRWTVRLVPQQFGPAGAIVKLPFQSVHPEFNLNIGPYGLVHASLSIPGNGTFEASEGMLRIRPYSTVRDESQQIDGRRFFDNERVNWR